MRRILTDCTHALRLYRHTPGASLTAVVMLAIGVAFVGAFLSLYVDLVLRPDPGFERSRHLATVAASGGQADLGVPFTLLERMPEELSSVEAAATVISSNAFLGNDPEPVPFTMVSAGFFDGLRPRLALGRGFTPEGLPAGLEFLGRPFTEARLLGFGFAYEQATKHRRPSPIVPPLAATGARGTRR